MSNAGNSKFAMVTGASYGIGAAIAVALARDGFDVAVCDLTEDMLSQTITTIEQSGGRAIPVKLDLRSNESITGALDYIHSLFGRLDVLVNNAGVAFRKDAIEVTREEWNNVLDVNLTGTFFMSQAVGAAWIKAGQPGTIVNIASTHGIQGVAMSSTYGVSKAGVGHLTRMLAIEWAPHNIRVNAVAPGSTVTPTRKGLSDPAKRDMLVKKFPLGRFGQPEDMAEAVAYLASEKAAFVTGHILVVDGGLTAK
jgi:NAD(P)-dependent dehydrogenase (short-subunit alcohol dehydrogenase family)